MHRSQWSPGRYVHTYSMFTPFYCIEKCGGGGGITLLELKFHGILPKFPWNHDLFRINTASKIGVRVCAIIPFFLCYTVQIFLGNLRRGISVSTPIFTLVPHTHTVHTHTQLQFLLQTETNTPSTKNNFNNFIFCFYTLKLICQDGQTLSFIHFHWLDYHFADTNISLSSDQRYYALLKVKDLFRSLLLE